MRATKHKHYAAEQKVSSAKTSNNTKSRKALRASSVGFAAIIAATAFIVPTTTLAPGVEAYSDSRIASYAVGDINHFASAIADNCAETTTVPVVEVPAVVETKPEEPTVAELTTEAVEETKPEPAEEKTEATEAEKEETVKEEETTPAKAESSAAEETEDDNDYSEENDDTDSYSSYVSEDSGVSYSGSVLVDIANPDYSYNPSYVSLSSYDRAKLERLVMGEAGTMGFTGCALVAQSIRDSMNRSGTSSIDQIIYEYQYFGSTCIEPNQDVLDAVSYIFDENGSAVQHRVLCFYIGYSAWHETQTFLCELDGVRFFDLNF